MDNIIINAAKRADAGVRGKLKNLRDSKMVPGVIYGGKKEPITVSVSINDLLKILKDSKNSVVTLKYDDTEEKVIIKNIQKHVVTDKIIHVDFNRVLMDKKVDIKVPIKFIGEPYGVKTQGGLIEYDMRELNIRCLPADIPQEITIDIAPLKIGDIVRVKNIKAERFELRDNPENIIISIVTAKEEVVAQSQPATQPEVIEKGKKPAEGEEPAKEAPAKEAKKEDKK
ncbi:MAG: 50S ribosomal protein L25 [Elusimicrobiales bacterium]|nr:50S ribosomal protein L25 [Elusimicrobiales bacterium]